MAQQVYNVGVQATDNLVKALNPLTLTADPFEALEYENSGDAASVANYLNNLYQVTSYVVVGPHPKPHR